MKYSIKECSSNKDTLSHEIALVIVCDSDNDFNDYKNLISTLVSFITKSKNTTDASIMMHQSSVSSKTTSSKTTMQTIYECLNSHTVADAISIKEKYASARTIAICKYSVEKLLKDGVNTKLIDLMNIDNMQDISELNIGLRTKKLICTSFCALYALIESTYDQSNFYLKPVKELKNNFDRKFLNVSNKERNENKHYKSLGHENFSNIEQYRNCLISLFKKVRTTNIYNYIPPEFLFFSICSSLRVQEFLRTLEKLHLKEYKIIDDQTFLVTISTKEHKEFNVPICLKMFYAFQEIERHYAENFSIKIDNAKACLYQRLKHLSFTFHGLRSFFCDCYALICDEQNILFDSNLVEMCLDHSIGNSVTRAYLRSDRFGERAKIMKVYTDFVFECFEQSKK